MQIFLSWSGARSKAVAELMRDWIRCVLQASRPWISTRDIDRGSVWFGEIHDQLKDTSVGIICLTQENKNRPWILFEAGALAKGLNSSRVCTFLVDLAPKDIEDPLAQFNHTMPERDSVLRLVETVNGHMGSNGLDPAVLQTVFDTYWPQFEHRYEEILQTIAEEKALPPRQDSEILAEILENTRQLTSRVSNIERYQTLVQRASQQKSVGVSPETLSEIREMVLAKTPVEIIRARFRARGIPSSFVMDVVRAVRNELLHSDATAEPAIGT